MAARLELTLFGTCAVRVRGDRDIEIAGAKHRALFVLLATAPLGRRTRAYLQHTLWGDPGYDSGHQNLRRALSDLRKIMGPLFDRFIRSTQSDVELDMEYVRFASEASDGVFLDGLAIPQREFQDWLRGIRSNPDQIAGLFRSRPRATRAKPRVTVLPLSVLGLDPELSALGDWLAEELCRSLSRSNLVMVISHLSSRAAGPLGQNGMHSLRETLDVDYIMTGGLRRQGDALVVDMDFVDATTGEILWSRNLTCPAQRFAEDIHESLAAVVQAMGRTMADGAVSAIRGRHLPEIETHQLTIAAVALIHRPTLRDFLRSRELFEEALDRMPRDPDLHAWLGKWFVMSVFNDWTMDRTGDIRRALEYTGRALELDPEGSFGLTIDGFARNNLMQDMSTASQRYDAALRINPNESLSWLLRGTLDAFQDDGEAAISGTEMARRLSPIDPFGYFYDSLAASAHVAAQNFDRALELADQSLACNDRHISTHRVRITALHFLDRGAEAREAAQELIRRQPEFRLDHYRHQHPSAQNKVGQRVIEALDAAGIS